MFAKPRLHFFLLCCALKSPVLAVAAPALPSFFEAHCLECHDSDKTKGGLNLATLSTNMADPAVFARWVKIHDRVQSGEMPPPDKKAVPLESEKARTLSKLKADLVAADLQRLAENQGQTRIRRLTRV
jgi:hypothetical protein